MFSNKWHDIKISTRNKKLLTFDYKSSTIKNLLINHQFTLFYYYDFQFLSKESEISFKESLQELNLNHIKIKRSTPFLKFKDLAANNVLIIYSKEKTINFDYTFVKKLKNIPGLFFLGINLNQKFFRPSEIEKLFSINEKTIQKQTLLCIKQKHIAIKELLTTKKC